MEQATKQLVEALERSGLIPLFCVGVGKDNQARSISMINNLDEEINLMEDILNVMKEQQINNVKPIILNSVDKKHIN